MNEKNFVRELPDGYRQVFYLNAKQAKAGIVMNLIALAVLVAVVACGLLPYFIGGIPSLAVDLSNTVVLLLVYLAFLAILLLYVVLHELVHGIVYKWMTGEKLTFGMSWSCAFCGVPHIYTTRKTVLLAVSAPLAVFTLLFLPALVGLYFVHPLIYFLGLTIFGLHLGGCCGDIYVLLLLLFKYKDARALVRDTGPEQFIYLPELPE